MLQQRLSRDNQVLPVKQHDCLAPLSTTHATINSRAWSQIVCRWLIFKFMHVAQRCHENSNDDRRLPVDLGRSGQEHRHGTPRWPCGYHSEQV